MANQKNTALLIIDVQQGLFKKSTSIYKAEELLENINMLVDRAHRDGVPVFYIQHSDTDTLVKGSHDWQLHAQLHPQNIDTIIHKQHGNAFEETNLEKILQSNNTTNLVITGLVTHGCVRATCIGAQQLGYRVILIKDGHSNYSKDAPRIIEKWNRILSAKDIELKFASEVEFS